MHCVRDMADEHDPGEANDKEKTLIEDGNHHEVPRHIREKKKKRKARRSKSSEDISSSDVQNGGYLRQVSSFSHGEKPLPLEPMGSREKLIHIHEELDNTHSPSRPEIFRDEKDLRKLALNLAISKSNEGKNSKFLHHDYVLVHRTGDIRNLQEKLRKKYESELHAQGFRVDRKYTAENTFVVLHCSFERLCEEAEHVSLEMPLAGVRPFTIL